MILSAHSIIIGLVPRVLEIQNTPLYLNILFRHSLKITRSITVEIL